MSQRPWHKRYHSDALTGYRGLTLEERGAYNTILDLLYDSGEEALPAHERWMTGQLNCSTRKWRAIRATLIAAGKIDELPDGRITNARYLRERAKTLDLSGKRAEAGSKGGKAKSLAQTKGLDSPMFDLNIASSGRDDNADDTAKTAENSDNGLAIAKAKPPVRARDPDAICQNQSNEHESVDDGIGERSVVRGKGMGEGLEPQGRSLFDQVCDAAGYNPISPAHIAAAHDQIRAWRDAGIDFEAVVLPTIREVIANTNDPTSSLIRFDKRIRHQHAKRAATPEGRPYKPPAAPMIDNPGEEPCMAALRADLLKALGPQTYARYANAVLLESLDQNDQRILRVTDKRPPSMSLMDADRAPKVRAIAKRHGFDTVW